MKKTLLVTLLALASGSVMADADSIYYGGNILTMNDAQPLAEAVAIKNGRILAVGDLATIKAEHNKTDTELVNLNGRTLMPGFIDSHGHISQAAIKKSFVNMDPAPAGNVGSIKDIQRNFNLELAKREEGDQRWLIGWGYDHAMLEENRHPTRHDLDAISAEIPILLIHFSSHQVVANSKMLEIAGFDETSKDPAGGVIVREADGKTPNGILEEYASKPVIVSAILEMGYGSATDLPEDFISGAMQMALMNIMEDYVSQGFTTAIDAGTGLDVHYLLTDMGQKGLLPIDIAAAIFYFQADAEQLSKLYSPIYDNNYRMMGGKIALDGGSPGRTANLRQPYHQQLKGEEDYVGYASVSDETAKNFISGLYQYNVPAFIHALGDAAVDQAIEVVRFAESAHEGNDRRTQLIHLQQVQADQFETMQALDVTLTYQMAHNFYFADFHAKHIYGSERTKKLNPIQSGIDYGFSTTIHHDAPVHPIDQFTIIWAAVNRTSRSGKVWGEDERISVMDALKASTINAAYQLREEDSKGSLEQGKLADMIIIDQNPLTVEPQKLKDLKVLETIKEGRSIYTEG